METSIEKINWEETIHRSVTLKNDIVESDLFEENKRKILNFGHTLGHAIESFYLSKEKDILHGEAIALGMYLEAELSPLKYRKEKRNSRLFEVQLQFSGLSIFRATPTLSQKR